MKKLSAFLLLTLSFFLVNSAQADYVCQVTYWPSKGTTGDNGHLRVSFSTQSTCPSAGRVTYSLCSQNSTSSACARDDAYKYSLTVLMVHFQALIDAAQSSSKVNRHIGDCEGGVTACLITMEYLP